MASWQQQGSQSAVRHVFSCSLLTHREYLFPNKIVFWHMRAFHSAGHVDCKSRQVTIEEVVTGFVMLHEIWCFCYTQINKSLHRCHHCKLKTVFFFFSSFFLRNRLRGVDYNFRVNCAFMTRCYTLYSVVTCLFAVSKKNIFRVSWSHLYPSTYF